MPGVRNWLTAVCLVAAIIAISLACFGVAGAMLGWFEP
jgi:hypothetical protein